MSSSTSSSRTSTWAGIALGVVILGLLAAFAIALPKANGGDDVSAAGSSGATSTAPLKLPDTLSDGYTATDLATSFTGPNAKNADAISKQQQAMREYGDTQLAKVFDHPAVTRNYTDKDVTHVVYVQAFRAAGGAFAPDAYVDPSAPAAQTQGSQQLVGVDGAVCIESRAPASSTTGAVAPDSTPTYTQCQVSDSGITVQVGGQSLTATDVAGIAHVVEDALTS